MLEHVLQIIGAVGALTSLGIMGKIALNALARHIARLERLADRQTERMITVVQTLRSEFAAHIVEERNEHSAIRSEILTLNRRVNGVKRGHDGLDR